MAGAAVACAVLAGGCAHRPPPRVEPLASASAEARLGCTPLLLLIQAPREGELATGLGSGVLVHPRLILTAGHVTPEDASMVFAYTATAPVGELMIVDRVVRGERRGAWQGDWALLVLSRPFATLPAEVASRLPDPGDPCPEPGRELMMTGFPLAAGTEQELNRRPTLVSTRVVRAPWASDEPTTFYAQNAAGSPLGSGASGAPVVASAADGAPVLVGIAVGISDRYLGPLRLNRTIVVHEVPVEEIRRLVSELDR